MKQMKLWMTMRLIVSIIVLAIFMSFCFVQEVAFLSILGSFCGILMWLLVIIYSYSSKQVKLILKEYELDIDSLIDNEIIRYQNYFVSDYFIIKKGFITMQVLYREDVSHAHYYENGVHVEAKIGKKMEIPLIDELFEKEVKYFLGSITNGIDAYCEDSHDALHEFYKKGEMKCNVSVADFLSLIKYATYVVTDSFHATAFSINFNTNFMIVFPEKYSTRVKSILEITGLESRIVTDYNNISLASNNIDFKNANRILKLERKKAKDYLDEVLGDEQ